MNKTLHQISGLVSARLALVAIMLLGFASAALAQCYMTFGNGKSINVKPGTEVEIPFNLVNPGEKITSLQADFKLPEGVEYISMSRYGDRYSTLTHDVYCDSLKTNKGVFTDWYRYTMFCTDTKYYIKGEEGAIAMLKVKVADDFRGGMIQLREMELSANGVPVASAPAEGSVKLNVEIGQLSFAPAPLKIATDGSKTRVDVVLTNDLKVYGLQMDMKLPTGMKMVREVDDYGYEDIVFEGNNERLLNVTIAYNAFTEDSIRIVAFDRNADPFQGNEGTLFSFYVQADETLADVSTIKVTGVILTNDKRQDVDLDDIELEVNKDISSGLDRVQVVNESDIVGIYTMDGVQLNSLAKGAVNVVKYRNGAIRKVVVR